MTDVSSTPFLARRHARHAVLVGVLAAIVLVVTLVANRGGSDDTSPPRPDASTSPEPTASATPLADYDTTALVVQRAGFCDLVDAARLETALGGAPGDTRTYDNGESTVLTSEVTDITAEHGCRWKRGRTVARAWVFAPPTTVDDARRLVRATRGADGCAVRRDAPAYGAPTVARTCPVGQGFEASYRGLFGDAWLTCALTAPGTAREVLARADAWCVAVAEAAAQPPA